MQETHEMQFWSLGYEDPLEKNGNHSAILAWDIPWIEEPGGLQSMGHKESDMTKQLSTHTYITLIIKLIFIGWPKI